MIETHPYEVFVPANANYLILGSFIAKKNADDIAYDWFYGSRRNQFWPILEVVYNFELKNKKAKQELLANLKIAITDIIYQCVRINGSSLDANLTNFVYNTAAISEVLKTNNIQKIFFSSRFVEKEYRKNFKELMERYSNVELITLPSPSPRYAAMRKEEKIRRYKELLPKLY